jgi:hypothetical protein
VPLELRVLAQVTPDNAPFVVASVGGLPEIENNIMVPTIRSIVRNVVGAQGRHVFDLADNRAALVRFAQEETGLFRTAFERARWSVVSSFHQTDKGLPHIG